MTINLEELIGNRGLTEGQIEVALVGFQKLPKAELHVHHVGTLSAAAAKKLAIENGTTPPESIGADRYVFESLPKFLVDFREASMLFTEPLHFYRLGYAAVRYLHGQGVVYSELAFSPALHAIRLSDPDFERHHSGWYFPLDSFIAGIDAACERYRVKSNVVVDIGRSCQSENYLGRSTKVDRFDRVVEAAVRWSPHGSLGATKHGARVVALGLGGNESKFGNELFVEQFTYALEQGLESSPHAGEVKGAAESVRTAITDLRAKRIDHGIGVMSDPRLVELAKQSGIYFNVCPTSNELLGGWDPKENPVHPIVAMHRAGLKVTINSDDPEYFGSPVSEEFARCYLEFGMTLDEITEIAKNGFRAAFGLSDHERERGFRAVDKWRSDFSKLEKRDFRSRSAHLGMPTAHEYLASVGSPVLEKGSPGLERTLK